ncbi:hypothetical protein ACUZ9P_08810 [Desulfovibrio sp. QI0430]
MFTPTGGGWQAFFLISAKKVYCGKYDRLKFLPMLAPGAEFSACQGWRVQMPFLSPTGAACGRGNSAAVAGSFRVDSFINNMGGNLRIVWSALGHQACIHGLIALLAAACVFCAFSGLREQAGNISKCTGIGPHIAKALARAIRPEVDGGASFSVLLPTQGAAYASRHV